MSDLPEVIAGWRPLENRGAGLKPDFHKDARDKTCKGATPSRCFKADNTKRVTLRLSSSSSYDRYTPKAFDKRSPFNRFSDMERGWILI